MIGRAAVVVLSGTTRVLGIMDAVDRGITSSTWSVRPYGVWYFSALRARRHARHAFHTHKLVAHVRSSGPYRWNLLALPVYRTLWRDVSRKLTAPACLFLGRLPPAFCFVCCVVVPKDFEHWSTTSWPSGHAATAMSGLLFLAYVLWRDLGALVMVRPPPRTAALLCLERPVCVCVCVCVCSSLASSAPTG